MNEDLVRKLDETIKMCQELLENPEAIKQLEDQLNPPTFEFKPERNCDGCTACCEGWLTGDVHGKYMYSGNPCHYKKQNGCAIYDDRPPMCTDFRCAWLDDGEVPEWMKPNLSKVIMYWRSINDIPYLAIVEAGKPIDSTVLNWLVQSALKKNINIRYMVNGGWNMIGSTEFIEEINK